MVTKWLSFLANENAVSLSIQSTVLKQDSDNELQKKKRLLYCHTKKKRIYWWISKDVKTYRGERLKRERQGKIQTVNEQEGQDTEAFLGSVIENKKKSEKGNSPWLRQFVEHLVRKQSSITIQKNNDTCNDKKEKKDKPTKHLIAIQQHRQGQRICKKEKKRKEIWDRKKILREIELFEDGSM